MLKKDREELPSLELSEKFDMLSPMLDAALNEMREFSKKKQDGVLNTFKVKIINRLLVEIKILLSCEKSTIYLDTLDEDTLPQNSDAVLILGQFTAAMSQFKNKYYGWDGNEHKWFTKEPGIKL